MIERVKISGSTAKQVAETVREAEHSNELWPRPMVNAAMSCVERRPQGQVANAATSVTAGAGGPG